MSDLLKFVGLRIRNYRINQNLSQEKLAELSNCHPTYIGQIERGEKNATLESIWKITSALSVSLSSLFEKIECHNEVNDIPLQCYEFLLNKSKKEQEKLFLILQEISAYKNQ